MNDINLYNGDCLDVMDDLISKNIKVDAIITDPPYGTTACKWDSVIPFNEMWSKLKQLRKDHTPIVLFGSEPFSSALRMSNIKEFKYDWIWEKNTSGGFILAKKQPMKFHEIISVFYNKQCLYNPQMEEYSDSTKKRFKNGDKVNRTAQLKNSTNKIHGGLSKEGIKNIDFNIGKYPSSVKFFKNVANSSKSRFFSTQKPVALLEYLIKTYTNENDIVLDFTMGSGTAGVACVNLNRKFIGIEKEENYFKITQDRIKKAIEENKSLFKNIK